MNGKCSECGNAVTMSSDYGVFEPMAVGCLKLEDFDCIDCDEGCQDFIKRKKED